MNNKVIYISVAGGYDNIIQPKVVDDSFDYICFSDRPQVECVGVWHVRKNPYYDNDKKRTSVWARLHPHILLPEYEYSLYLDANICICEESFYKLVNKHIENGDIISQVPHPTRNCIYLELEQCLNTRKVTPCQYISHHQKYMRASLPKEWGLYENNVILRKHNDSKVVAIDQDWWNEYESISNRDQLSLMLVYWKHQYKPTLLLGDMSNTRNSSCVMCMPHVGTHNNRPHCFLKRACHFVIRNTILVMYRCIYGIDDYYSKW